MHNSGASRREIAKSCLELEQTPSFRGDAKHRTRNDGVWIARHCWLF